MTLRRPTLPEGFFNFDLRDTLRLVVWIVIVSFAAGLTYNQRLSDLSRLDAVDTATSDRVAELKKRLDQIHEDITAKRQSDAQIAVTLEAIRTELRYVNEKIDVLRQDVRSRGDQ